MKKANKLFAFFLAMIMIASCFSGLISVVAEDGGAGAEPDTTMYAELNFNQDKTWDEIMAEYGIWGVYQSTVEKTADADFITIKSENNDPSFIISGDPVKNIATSNMDYIVIKYRTSDISGGEFWVDRSDGVSMGMAGSVLGYSYNPSGEWETVIVDASQVWGNAENATFYQIRFDFADSAGTLEVEYLRFFATAEGAQACVDAENEATTPEVDTNMYAELNFNQDKTWDEIMAEYGIWGVYQSTVEKTADADFITIKSENNDPSFIISGDPVKNIATSNMDYIVIKYRTSDISGGEFWVERSDGVSMGMAGSVLGYSYNPSGEWETVIVDASQVWGNAENATFYQIRFDFAVSAGTLEVEYLRFFATAEGAQACVDADKETDDPVGPDVPDVPDVPDEPVIPEDPYVPDPNADKTLYVEIDFTKFMETPVDAYGIWGLFQAEENWLCDKGYLALKSTGTDPSFVIAGDVIRTTTTDNLDYVVIKYRTTEIAKGEFFAARNDGVGWAAPAEKSYASFSYNPSGNWETVIIDASNVWGNVENVNFNDIRFDFATGLGSIDIAYLRFYATREGAEACVEAEKTTITQTVTVSSDDALLHQGEDGKWYYGEDNIPVNVADDGSFTYEKTVTCATAPAVPFNPDNLDVDYVIDGSALNGESVGNLETPKYSFADGYITYVATKDDPQVIFPAGIAVGPYMAIKYRAHATTSDASEIFIGASANPNGLTDNRQWAIINDGEWHIAIVEIGSLEDYDNETNTVNHIRFDPLRSATAVAAGDSIDIEYIAFFGDEGSAKYYAESNLHELPKQPTYTVTFVVNGIEIAIVEYVEGATELEGAPAVPPMKGYTAEWESYTLNNTNIVVNAVYTKIETDTDPTDTDPTDTEPVDTEPVDTEPVDTEPVDTEPVTNPETAEPSTDAPAGTDAETNASGDDEGCKSVVSFGLVALLTAMAAAVALKRRED